MSIFIFLYIFNFELPNFIVNPRKAFMLFERQKKQDHMLLNDRSGFALDPSVH